MYIILLKIVKFLFAIILTAILKNADAKKYFDFVIHNTNKKYFTQQDDFPLWKNIFAVD